MAMDMRGAAAGSAAPPVGAANVADAAGEGRAGIARIVRTLSPLIVGLAFSRAGLIVASYGSYRQSDEGLFTDGAMLVALFILLIPFALVTASKRTIPKTWVNRIARACMAAEALFVFAIGAFYMSGSTDFPVHFGLSVACTLAASGAMYYWLRRMRGAGTIYAVVFVFAALILSEVELYIMAVLPEAASVFVAGALSLVQFPCMVWARGRTTPYSREKPAKENAFPGFDEGTLKSRQLLIAMAVSIGLLGLLAGFLRGYPDGAAIPFAPATRLAYAALAIAISVATIALTVGPRKHVMPVGFFLILELLACCALVLYAAFPDMLDLGAVFTTALNALMVGLAWYIIVAFMSYGWRDPYYYAMAGWFVWLGARACARVAFILAPGVIENSALAIALAAFLVVLSTQATLTMFLSIERRHVDSPVQPDESPSALVRIMGLDKGQSLADARQDSLRRSAEIIGSQFLLSEREVEVLALYASGMTQKRVAEELFITQSTAHEHIKRIYTKTGLHSRQEILDYIEHYAS